MDPNGFEAQQGYDLTSTRDFTSPFYTPAAEPGSGMEEQAPAPNVDSGSSSSSSSSNTNGNPAHDFYSEMFPSLPTSSAPKLTQAPVMAASKSRDVNERFQIIPQQLRSSGVGEHSHTEICKRTMAETGTKIEFSLSKNGIMTLILSGKPNQVAEAKKKLLSSMSKQYEVKVEIPKEHMSSFIGKGGSKLKGLQEKTGATIRVPRQDSEEKESYVTISGDLNSVEQARKEVLEFVNEKTNFVRETVTIEQMYMPFVCGLTNNENIKAIVEETGAKIHGPTESNETELTVSGQREQVSEALKKLQTIYTEKKRTTKSISVGVNKKQHRFIIGQKGSNISEILKQTGCNVTIPPQDDSSDVITVSGDDAMLLKALQLVLEKANSVCLEEIPIEGAFIQRYVKVKGRNEMKELEKGTKVTVNVGPTSVDVQGSKEEVETVRKLMIDLLASYRKLKFEEMEIPLDLRKFVIGKNGQTLKKIKADFGVDVFVPNEDDSVQTALIAGDKDKVKQAKDALAKIVKEMANMAVIEIKVDPKFFKTVIGKKGETIKKLNDEFETCAIKVPAPTDATEVITIRGPKPDLDKLREKIVKIVEDTKHYEIMHSFTEEVMIEKRAMKYIVGKGGVFINRIREANDVKIDINPEEEKADNKPAAPAAGGEKGKGKEGEKQAEKGGKQGAAPAADAKGKGKEAQPAAAKGKEGEKGGKQGAAPAADAKGKGKEAQPAAKTEAKPDAKGKGKKEFDESLYEKVVIQGTKQGVEKAKQELLEKAKEMMEGGGMVTEQMQIEQKYHKHLIGKDRKFVKSLMDRHSITVRFPRLDAPSDTVVLHGMKKAVEKAQAELLEYEKSMNHTQTITAENKVLQQVMGIPPHSKTKLIHISETTHTHIEFLDGDKESNKLIVRGPEKNVEEAKKLIETYIKEIVDTVTIEVKVEPKYFKVLIGLKGATVREMSDKHQVDIKFPEDKSSDVVKITGSKKHAEAAKKNIEQITKETEEKEANQGTKTVEIDQKYHPGLRDFVRNNPEQFFAKVLFPKENDPPHTILLRGKESDIDKAIDLLKANLEESVTIKVEKEHHKGLVMHPQNREICSKHNVVIRIPNKESNSTNVVLRGKQANIEAAEQALRALIDLVIESNKEAANGAPSEKAEKSEAFKEVLAAKAEHLGQIIGKKGANLKQVQEMFGVKIDVKKEQNQIVVSGNKQDAVLGAKAELQEIISNAENKNDLFITVDSRFHSKLAGPRFSNIHKIQEDFNVTVRFPRNDNPGNNNNRGNKGGKDTITIVGNPDDSKAAADYILQVVREIEFDFSKNQSREEDYKKQQQGSSSQPREKARNEKQQAQNSPLSDPFFAPPPQSTSTLDKTSVWGSKMN